MCSRDWCRPASARSSEECDGQTTPASGLGPDDGDAVHGWVVREVALAPVDLAVVVDRHGGPHLGAVHRGVVEEAIADWLGRILDGLVDRPLARLDDGAGDGGFPTVRHAPDL